MQIRSFLQGLTSWLILHGRQMPGSEDCGTQGWVWDMEALYQPRNNPHWVTMCCLKGELQVGVSMQRSQPHLATQDKIWRGEFVDVFSLLFRKPEPKPWPQVPW